VRFVATSFGSAGDFFPTLAIAEALHSAGHDVVFVANPFHEGAVRQVGLRYVAAGERIDVYKIIREQPQLLHGGIDGVRALAELLPTVVGPTYWTTRALLRGTQTDAAIGSDLSFGLLWAATEARVPTVVVAATPVAWLDGRTPEQFLDHKLPEGILKPFLHVGHRLAITVVDQWLRSVARSVGATSIDPSLTAIRREAALHLGMWSALVRPASAFDAANQHVCGFARGGHLGTEARSLPDALESFLAAGPAPVVIGLGSIFSLGADDLIADAAEACLELGYRCVLVGAPPRKRTLPSSTLVVPYAAYHLLFPRAKVVVVHGGAGTTSEALLSGRPMVVVPFAFDQFAIAWRVEQLRAGVRLAKAGRTRANVLEAIRSAATDPALELGARSAAETLHKSPPGAEVAMRLVARLKMHARDDESEQTRML
jgi:UDP-N-acetylglucosamine:LPS N-acetylglucosamine transferase